ncbi:arylacetamide deacetylase-like 4 [Acipenser ruthenus]|uniref:arylacetamide deacetylase-like 4 n=1 Tax=Acipenser ruthenus TaxID=7906 RepID=UPI002741B077|nr:arylacetamide deacetylase-like 4 [Acipenser ruthenus]
MELGVAIIILCFAAVFAAFMLLVFGLIYAEFSNSEIPLGVAQPGKLRLIHGLLVGIAVLGRIFQNMGLCTQVGFTRWVSNTLLRTSKVPPQLLIKDLTFAGVPVRVYQPKAPSSGHRRGLLYFHGGGWMLGSIDTYDDLCRYIAKESATVVVSVGYRLSPEHRYPAQLDDCLAATSHFLEVAEADYGVDPRKVAVGGDSAGGNLSAALCHRFVENDLPLPCAQILIYPVLQMADFNLPSYQQNQYVPLLYRTRMGFYYLHYLNGDTSLLEDVLDGRHVPVELELKYRKWLGPDNLPPEFKTRGFTPRAVTAHDEEVYDIMKDALEPSVSPLLASDTVLCKMPPTFILTCEFDVLRDDGILFKKRLDDLGVPVTWWHVQDGFHGIVSFFDKGWLTYPSGKLALDHIVSFVKTL